MHGVREHLLRAQIEAAGLPAIVVHIPFPCSNETYEQKMAATMDDARASGVTHVIFGDLFLEDVRAYRERQLSGTGIMSVFLVWGRPTAALAHEMIYGGVESHLSTVDLRNYRLRSPAGALTMRCSIHCLPVPTRAGKTANSIPLYRPVRCCRARSRSKSARLSSAMDSPMQICCQLRRATRRRCV